MNTFGTAGDDEPCESIGGASGPAEGPSRPVWQRAVGVYLRVFVFCAVVFGTVEGLLHRSVVGGVTSGLVFGVLMSALTGTRTVRRQRDNTGSWSPRRHVTFEVPDGPQVARRQACLALEQLRVTGVHDSGDTIRARTGLGWGSWGSTVTVHFAPAAVSTRVEVKIRPQLPIAPVDTGGARDIVDTLTYYLTPTSHQDGT